MSIPTPITWATEKREIFTKALFSRPESLTALLPYDEFIEDGNIFQLKDGSLGAVFELTLLEHEPLTEKQVINSVEGLKPLFSLPENCTLQILFEQSRLSPFDKKISNIEKSYPDAHPVSKLLFSEKVRRKTKEAVLMILAHQGSKRVLATLEKYSQNPDRRLKVFSQLALNECEMWNE